MGISLLAMFPLSDSHAQEKPMDITHDITPWLERIEATRAMSTSKRFLVSGMSREGNVEVASWADDVLGKLERFVAMKLPWEAAQSFHIAARTNAQAHGHAILKTQGWLDGRIKQRLVIHEPETADQEEILEGLCWLLLNDFALARIEPFDRVTSFAQVPDWFSVGTAQNLYPLARERNSRLALEHWNAFPSVEQILSFEIMPEGRWLEKAACGLFVDWLRSQPQSVGAIDKLLERVAARQPVSVAWFLRVVARDQSLRDMEKQWDVWIAGQKLIRWQLGELSPDRLLKLKEYSTVRTQEVGFLIADTLPAVLTLDDFVTYGESASVKRLAEWSSIRIKSLGIGEPEYFRAVIAAYGDFLDAVGRGEGRQSTRLAKAKQMLEEFERVLHSATSNEDRYPAWLAMSRSIADHGRE